MASRCKACDHFSCHEHVCQEPDTGEDVQVLEQTEDVRSALKRLAAISNKPGLDGCLPETMPAGVLLTPYLQSLQLALLPFQVSACYSVLHALQHEPTWSVYTMQCLV